MVVVAVVQARLRPLHRPQLRPVVVALATGIIVAVVALAIGIAAVVPLLAAAPLLLRLAAVPLRLRPLKVHPPSQPLRLPRPLRRPAPDRSVPSHGFPWFVQGSEMLGRVERRPVLIAFNSEK